MLISKFEMTNSDNIVAYEDKVGVSLPAQYRSFLLKYNGGETPNTSFASGGESSDVKVFFGLGNVKYSLNKVMPLDIAGERYLPIASDSFGNDILINLGNNNIFFHNHENGKIVMIAKELQELFNICHSSPISPSAVKSVEEREQELIAKGRGNIITEALRNMWKAEIEKYSSIILEEVTI